jgi:hypothetical protein
MIDPLSLITVVTAAASSRLLKEVAQKLWENIKKKHDPNSVTIIGPNGAKVSVDPSKPLTEEQIRQVTE